MKTAFYIIGAFVIGVLISIASSEALARTDISSIASIIGVIAGMGVFLMAYISIGRIYDRNDMAKRIVTIGGSKEKRQMPSNNHNELFSQSSGAVETLGKFAQKLLAVSDNKIPDIRNRLISAGFYSDRAVTIYILCRLVFPLWNGASSFLLASALLPGQGLMIFLISMLGAVIGHYEIEIFLDRKIKSRREKMNEEFPDVIDMFMIFTESGLAFDAALPRVIETMKKHAPIICKELSFFQYERNYLPDRMVAFKNLNSRCDIPMVKNFTGIIHQSEVVGTPIARAMKVLSQEARKEKVAAAERRGAKIPVYLTLPTSALLLPAVFIVVLAPAAINIMEAFKGFGN